MKPHLVDPHASLGEGSMKPPHLMERMVASLHELFVEDGEILRR